MDVLVQHPREIRADIVSSCEHGWVNDKLDSGLTECNLMDDVGSKFVDDLVLLLPPPLDKCDDHCPSLEEPEDIKDEGTSNVFRTCSEEDTMASNTEIDDGGRLEIEVVKEIKSAMKGSRQQHGLEMKTPSVSWAPDVYDPPVTSQCHLVKPNSQKHSRPRKKSSKNKQKGKPIRNVRKVKK